MKELLDKLDSSKRYRDDEAILTREELILAREKYGKEALVATLLPAACRFLTDYVARYGWFYPPEEETLHAAMASLSEVKGAGDELNTRGRHGNSYLRSMFPSFWDVLGGPAAAFHQGEKLRKVVEYRLGLGKSKNYTYRLSDGRSVECVETFDFSFANIRRGFVVTHSSTSFFKPVAAVQIYKRWLEGREKPVVWDPSCGFGARLLAFASAFPEGTYIGNEPAGPIFRDLARLREALPARDVHLTRQGSEFRRFDSRVLDLVFTSPPYFDLEKYYDEPGQCWKDYPTLDGWVKNYLKPTLQAARSGLKPSGHLILNVDQKRRQLILDTAKSLGFTLIFEHKLLLGKDSFNKSSVSRWEPVLVWKPT